MKRRGFLKFFGIGVPAAVVAVALPKAEKDDTEPKARLREISESPPPFTNYRPRHVYLGPATPYRDGRRFDEMASDALGDGKVGEIAYVTFEGWGITLEMTRRVDAWTVLSRNEAMAAS